MENENQNQEKKYSLSEFRREVGLPLVVARKLITKGEISAVKAMDGTIHIAESEVLRIKEVFKNPRKKYRYFMKAIGPGLITGASNDDPSGIGTYSSVGAKFGLSIIWMAVWLFPIMLAVQEICARIGIVTNHGLTGVLKKHYRKNIVVGIIFLLLIANIINIGADLGAMAASLRLFSNINFYVAIAGFAIFIIISEIFISYHIYVKFLKWLTISIFAYIITGIIIHPDWWQVFSQALVPKIVFNKEYIFAMIAIFGTTITPYMFFWQTSEEVEEGKLAGITSKNNHHIHSRIRKMRTDVFVGMLLAHLAMFFIVLTTAQVLFKNGIYNIESAEQAAQALRPFAGEYAYLLFALGIIGTGLLAIPILAGSGAYAIAEVVKWREGLEMKFSRAKGFYLVIAFSIFFGMLFNFLNINPILALYYSAYINGIIALPLLIAIIIIGNNKKIMGAETNPKWVSFFGWLAVAFMVTSILISIFLKFN